MSLSKMIFNRLGYIPEIGSGDYCVVPKTITIPKGTRTVMLLTNNSDGTYGDLYLHEANFCNQITTKVIAYYEKYREYESAIGSPGEIDGKYKEWDNVYVISAKVTDLWDNQYNYFFIGLVSASDVISGG